MDYVSEQYDSIAQQVNKLLSPSPLEFAVAGVPTKLMDRNQTTTGEPYHFFESSGSEGPQSKYDVKKWRKIGSKVKATIIAEDAVPIEIELSISNVGRASINSLVNHQLRAQFKKNGIEIDALDRDYGILVQDITRRLNRGRPPDGPQYHL